MATVEIQSDSTPASAGKAAAIALAMAAGFYFYFLMLIDPLLLYHQQWPIFLLDRAFLTRFLEYPGGLSECVSAFITQFYIVAWAGALAVTVLAGLISLATGGILSAVSKRPVNWWLTLIPPVLILALMGRYNFVFSAAVAMLGALTLANIYVYVRPKSIFARGPLFVVLALAAFWLCAGYCLLFGALCAVSELTPKRRILFAIACVLLVGALPALYAIWSYDTNFARAYLCWLPFYRGVIPRASSSDLLQAAHHLSTPVVLLLMVVVTAIIPMPKANAGETTSRKPYWKIALTAGCVVLLAAYLAVSFDHDVKARVKIEYYAQQRQWDKLLTEAKTLPLDQYDFMVNSDVQRALYHTRRLAYDQFSYPQGAGFPSLWRPYLSLTGMNYAKGVDAYFDMGHVNLAQHEVHESFELDGPRSHVLKRLAQLSILKGEVNVAKVYLRLMAKSPMHRRWALSYLDDLDTDPQMRGDDEIRTVRPFLNKYDLPYGAYGTLTYDGKMVSLLKSNAQNRMAFEYMMSFFLATRQLEDVVRNVPFAGSFGYESIPDAYEQAVVMFMLTTPPGKVDLSGIQISNKTRRLTANFRRDIQRHRSPKGLDKQAAREALRDKYGQTFLYYWHFGPAVRGDAYGAAQTLTGATPMGATKAGTPK